VPASSGAPAAGARPADKVFTNGFIYTVDSMSRVAEAVAIGDGKFTYVGTNAGVRRHIGPRTEVVDLLGRMVTPGFMDGHAHVRMAGVNDLYGLTLPAGMPPGDYVPAIRAFADDHPDHRVIRGFGWEIARFITSGPRKEDLDAGIADRPVVITDSSGHNLWCNSRALEEAGITRDTPDPPNGLIERDPATGEPAGTLREFPAMRLVQSGLPDFTVSQYEAAYEHFQREVAGPLGVTTVFDPWLESGSNACTALERMARDGKLTVRMRAALYLDANEPLEPQIEAAVAERARHTTAMFRTDAVKLFVDGSGYSGWMLQPFATIPPGYPADFRGVRFWEQDELERASVESVKRGFHLHYHAIGDGAVRMALDAIEAARREQRSRVKRPAITHIFWVDPPDVPRLGRLGVVAVMQPSWMVREEYYKDAYVLLAGEEMAAHMFPMKSWFDQGLIVASSTDYPVTPLNPLDGIGSGVLRWNPTIPPGDVLWPEERVGVRQMIRSYTMGGAEACFVEGSTGSIARGKSADMVVLSRNILDCPPEQIFDLLRDPSAGTSVLMTVSGGEVVHKSPAMD